ncbi:THUMP-like domain-containing protein [Albibacterium indicum]|uniref:THUMP-like domain-containing protein n=1 Tax=Albibacterium indicum TaxID=2292082 RepID=UPI000E4BDBC7|nr:class I SAM-dependent methyltransferase [Pedobacter indicus]
MSLNEKILTTEVQKFIIENEWTDPKLIALKKTPFLQVNSAELAQQIESRRKAKKKLPTWYMTNGIYYPKALSIEQSSSEQTADFKRQLISSNESLIDLTGGFGVDAHYFSLTAKKVVHCEIDPTLSKISKHNAKVLNRKNIEFRQGNGIDILKKSNEHFDTIYIDPARRLNTKKVFLLQDCQPDILEHRQTLLERSKQVIVKTSPLLDISQTLVQLQNIKEVYILSIKNECKELLIVLGQEPVSRTKITAQLLNEDERSFSFFADEELEAKALFSEPESYIYDPDASLLKAGCFKLISTYYQLNKLHINTHLYTSSNKIENFAGRTFKIKAVMDYRDFKKGKDHPAASIISKNFPINSTTLRKKHKIKESAEHFLFFCKTHDENLRVISAERLSS